MNPPKDARCDVFRCDKPAVLAVKTKPFGFEGYFCLECYDALDKKGRLIR